MLVIILHVLIAAVAGALLVVSVLELSLAILMIWIAIVIGFSKHYFRAQQPQLARGVWAIHVSVMMLIVTSAYYAPVKTVDRALNGTVKLPKTHLTFAELNELNDSFSFESYPIRVSILVPPEAEETEIDFPKLEMTLREFVVAVESQSKLRHRFGHCGNGSTILFGGNCSFGLHFYDPTQFPR